ncbi:MAG: hypothetical protein AAF197_05330 [Pseudomonadota bacterium]
MIHYVAGFILPLLWFVLSLSVSAEEQHTPKILSEAEVIDIPLASPLDSPDAEISGLSWCDDKLIVLPQYPGFESNRKDKERFFYFFETQQIEAALESTKPDPLVPYPLKLELEDIHFGLFKFDGFEAIACEGDDQYVLIEAINIEMQYQSYLIPISIDWASSTVKIHSEQMRLVPPQTKLWNIGYEALLLQDKKVIAFHEVNSKKSVSEPKAAVIEATKDQATSLPFVDLPYRLTDVTALDQNKRFWAINYQWEGDKRFAVDSDPVEVRYGIGRSHQSREHLERLLEFKLDNQRISATGRTPIYLELKLSEGRNWEGLARWRDQGLLIATDKHPGSRFGFVAFNP